jgi:hypothetical protein
MSTICYSWNDAPYKWSEAPFTWKESCVIEKLISGPVAGGSSYIKKRRINKLDDEEKETLINLFVRLEVDEIVIEKRINKHKNSQVKIRLKDVEVLMKEQKNIKVNIKINE